MYLVGLVPCIVDTNLSQFISIYACFGIVISDKLETGDWICEILGSE